MVGDDSKMLGVVDGFELLKGVAKAKWKVVSEHEDLLKFSFPYYLKVDSSGHKTDLGGVVRCYDLEDAHRKLQDLHKRFPKNKLVIQESVDGIEMIVGVKRDDVFGKLLMVGFGGIFAEVKRDVSFRAFPVTGKDIKEMILELEGKGVFRARGKRYDLVSLVDLIQRVVLISEKKDFEELDLNPVIVGEVKSLVVDARVKL